EEVQVRAMLRVPAGTAEGRYVLKVAMVAPERGERIRLGLADGDAQARYKLCELTAVPRAPTQVAIYQTDFETDAAGWTGAAGMTAAIDDGAVHTGRLSLRVTGVQPKGWNYAACSVPEPLTPASKYRLTAWLLVEDIEPATSPPYIKIGVSDAEGKWLENYSSDPYDLKRKGTWQPLTVVADVPMNAASAHLAIEKGAHSVPIRATIRLDDVKLEMIESP
ncbi:MAG: carbohydrate binding domain-containing protein, partial [Patescibacteria group bacterium]|nr:carbohydrate binding domain-containing protein [Patescibacteria group bacterium]